MTYARTIAAVAVATLATVLMPQAFEVPSMPSDVRTETRRVEFEAIAPLPVVEKADTADIIDGIRIVAEDQELIDFVSRGVEKFDRAGWTLTNTEVRFDADACDGAVAFHAEENGHHVVVMCTVAEFTLLHELAHVWSDLYLDDEERDAWLELRDLESWDQGEWHDRGTEHVAEIVAFGLYDTVLVPSSMSGNDYRTLVEDFEWLMGIEPMHRQRGGDTETSHDTTARIHVAAHDDNHPVDAPEVIEATDTTITSAPAEYRFPIACGYPRWHSSHGGYGYVDPRDWTHVGVDIYALEGTPVVSPIHGVVVDAGWGDVPGWKVVVEDRFGHEHRMVHLARRPIVTVGSVVAAGQGLGLVGRSGNAAGGGPHLHYEIRLDGDTIDPMPWLKRTGDDNVEAAPPSLHTTAATTWSVCDVRA